MRRELKTIIVVFITLAVYAGVASGYFAVSIDTSLIDFTNVPSTSYFYGWKFTTDDIHITDVGLYDLNNRYLTHNPDGLWGTYKIAIWKLVEGMTWTLLPEFPVQITGGSAETAIENHQYVEVPGGVDLSAGTYFIAFWHIYTGQYDYDYILIFWQNAVAQNPPINIEYQSKGTITGSDPAEWTIPGDIGSSTHMGVNFQFTTAPAVITVGIDIKPGSYPNSVNLGSHGVVPVAILTDALFDATTVDPETVELAGAGVAVRGKGNKYLAHEEDVNDDGLIDLVLKVETENLDPGQFQDGYAILTGATYDGQAIEGMDEITIVPPE